MHANINGTDFPIERSQELKPIVISAAIGIGGKWESTLIFQCDTGADLCAVPMNIWLKIFGEPPEPVETATAENAVGSDASVVVTEISLRLETTDHEVVTLHKVRCLVAPKGIPVLGLNVLEAFRLVISRNELQEFRFNPRTKTWLGLTD